MKTVKELREILGKHSFSDVDAHIHTHLCDGAKDMTVENIAKKAACEGLSLIILTPHFHKKVSDCTADLYEDTDETILLRLREEIENYYAKGGKLQILLSTEADILNVDGETSLKITKEVEDALDLVTPTVNYHPLLPLKAVEVTYGRCIADIHSSGLYSEYASAVGGVERILETLYLTEVNALRKSPYPTILGHFFAAHSYAVGEFNWFGVDPCHETLMKDGFSEIIKACTETGSFVDITGIHCSDYDEKQQRDGFFFDLQKQFVSDCIKNNALLFPGSDSHDIGSVGDVKYYRRLI